MNSHEWMLRAVANTRRAEMTWWAVRLAAVAAGLGAGAQLMGITGGWLWSLAFVPVMAVWSVPDGRDVARRMDRAAGLHAELECAWDHRQATSAIHAAQRDRARARFGQGLKGRVVPVPHIAWFLPALLWFAVPATPAPADGLLDAGEAGQMAAPAAVTGAPAEAVSPAPRPKEAAARAAATGADPEARQDEAKAAEGGRGVAGATETGGVGTQAGDRSGGAAGRREVSLAGRAGESIAIGTALGAAGAGEKIRGRALVGRSPPPPDAIADPARRYPSRYHAAIAKWFDRERE